MGSRKSFLSKTSYMFGSSSDLRAKEGDELELDEADVWGLSNNNSNSVVAAAAEAKKGLRSGLKRGSSRKVVESVGSASSSLPVNIPDWSKILKEEHRKRDINDDDDDDYVDDSYDDDYDGLQVPPHVFLARTRGPSHSVQEGIGRTLKGRDLRRVRNAVWKKVGFED